MNYLADLMNLADPVNLIGLAILMIWVNLADETNLANLLDMVYLADLLVLVISVILLNLVNMVTLLVFCECFGYGLSGIWIWCTWSI